MAKFATQDTNFAAASAEASSTRPVHCGALKKGGLVVLKVAVVCVYMCVSAFVCMCMRLCLYICVYVCLHMCVYMCLCVSHYTSPCLYHRMCLCVSGGQQQA